MARDSVHFGQDVFTQCRCHFEMMAADRQIHQCLLSSESCKRHGPGSGSTVPLAIVDLMARGTSPLCAPPLALTSLVERGNPGYIGKLTELPRPSGCRRWKVL